jgi:hypothetical protein
VRRDAAQHSFAAPVLPRPGRCSLRKGDMLRGISFFSDGFHRFASHISPSEAPILSLLARREEGR